MTEVLLQVCPNDRPPFRDICAVYQAAAASVGSRMVTVFLSPPNATPVPDAIYLNRTDLRRTRKIAAALDAALAAPLDGAVVVLAICHRYRAYRVVRASRLPVSLLVAVAHEFGFFARWQRRLDQRLFARGVRFAGVSQPVVDELAQIVTAPLLMPNGMDLRRAQEQRVERMAARAMLGLAEARFNVGVVGRLHHKKQPGLALEGFSQVVETLPHAHLVFIGDGELQGELQAAAGRLPVSFAGFIPQAARYVSALDVLLIPSGEREAFSMVALEAMAAGVPVIAGPTPGPHFVLDDVGYYFADFAADALAAAVCDVYADRERCAERLARGQARVEREFSVPAVARRLRTLL